MAARKIECPSCAAPVAPEGIDEARALARCGYCGGVVDLSRPRPGEGGDGRPAPERPRVPLPDRFLVTASSGKGLRVTWRWFSAGALVLLASAVFWNGFMVFWMARAPLGMKLFGVVHACVGVFLAYIAAAGLFNRTTVTLAGGALEIRHRPLPWRGSGTWRAADLDQLYARERVRHSKNGTTVRYELLARTRGGRRVTLLRGLDDLDQALWLEREIEERLGILDEPVGGEVGR